MARRFGRTGACRILACAALVIGLAFVAAAQDKGPLPVPTRTKLEDAVGVVRKEYASDYAKATDAKGKRALARKLLDDADDQTAPERIFAALTESRRLAAEAGDAGTAMAALGELNSRCKFKDAVLVAIVLDTLEPLVAAPGLTEKDAAKIVPLALTTAGVSLDRQDYDRTARFGKVATKAAEKADDDDLRKDAAALTKFADELQKAAKTLATDPDDANANDILGIFWALVRSKWDIGLPYLTKSSDPGVKEAAAKDLQNPPTAKARLAVGDLWSKLSDTAKGDLKQRYAERAWEWYSASLAADRDEDNPATAKAAKIEKAYPNEFLKKIEGHTDEVNGVTFSPDGKFIASASYDNSVRLWDPVTCKETKKLQHDGLVWDLTFSVDGRTLATIEGYNVRTWDVSSGKSNLSLNHPDLVWGVAFSPDGKTLATADSKALKLWDATTGKAIKTLEGHSGDLREVRYFRDGSLLASTGGDGVKLWDTATNKVVRSLPMESATSGMAVSPDGKMIATSRSGLRIWSATTAKELQSMDPGTNTAGVMFGPNGRLLVTAHEDKCVRVWDTATGNELYKFSGYTERVNRAAISPDGRWVVGASKDPVMRRWRVSTILSRPLPAGKLE